MLTPEARAINPKVQRTANSSKSRSRRKRVSVKEKFNLTQRARGIKTGASVILLRPNAERLQQFDL